MNRTKVQKIPRTGSRAAQALATRRKLTAAALDLFAEQGYAATSTRQIAEAAGVSEGLIFHHFPTKSELLIGTMSEHEVLAHRVLAVLTDADDQPVRAQLRLIAQGFVTTLAPDRKETKALRLMLGESTTTPELGQVFKQTQRLVLKTIERYFRARIEAGELRSDLDVTVATRSLMGPLFFFFVTQQDLSSAAWRTKATAYTEALIEFWLRAAQSE